MGVKGPGLARQQRQAVNSGLNNPEDGSSGQASAPARGAFLLSNPTSQIRVPRIVQLRIPLCRGCQLAVCCRWLCGCRRGGRVESPQGLCFLKPGTEKGDGGEKATFCEIGRAFSVITIITIIILPVTKYFMYARFFPGCSI